MRGTHAHRTKARSSQIKNKQVISQLVPRNRVTETQIIPSSHILVGCRCLTEKGKEQISLSYAKHGGVILVRAASPAQILPRIYSYHHAISSPNWVSGSDGTRGGITSSISREMGRLPPIYERTRARGHAGEGKRRVGEARRTAAAKKVLSPISESTVMASDLVNPCRHRGEKPSATSQLHDGA